MQLTLMLAILAMFAAAESAPAEAVEQGNWRAALVVAWAMLVVAVAGSMAAVASRAVRRNFDERAAILRRFERWKLWHLGLWLVTTAVIEWGLAWPQVVRFNWGLAGWFLVDELLLLAPLLVPLVVSWAAFYEVEIAIEQGHAQCDGEPLPRSRRWRYVLMMVRQLLGPVLAPMILLLAQGDAAALAAPQWAQSDWGWTVYLPPLVLLPILLPFALRAVWQTEPLPAGPLRHRLEAAGRRAGLAVREILVWRTGGRLVNAAVAGFVPRLQYVFLTDGLLDRLTHEEIEAVFLHEAGHVRRRHLPLRLLLLCLPLWLWLAWQGAFPQATEFLELKLLALGFDPRVQAAVLWPGLLAGYAVLALGWYSRLLEHDADLWACLCHVSGRERADRPAIVSADSLITALQRLASESGIDPKRRTWLHPSLAERVGFLRRAALEPNLVTRFERRLAWIAWLLVAALLASPLLFLL